MIVKEAIVADWGGGENRARLGGGGNRARLGSSRVMDTEVW